MAGCENCVSAAPRSCLISPILPPISLNLVVTPFESSIRNNFLWSLSGHLSVKRLHFQAMMGLQSGRVGGRWAGPKLHISIKR